MTSERRSPKWPVLLVSFALMVAACTDDDAASTTTGPTEPPPTTTTSPSTSTLPSTTSTLPVLQLKPYGGEAVIGTTLEPPTLNIFAPAQHSVDRRI